MRVTKKIVAVFLASVVIFAVLFTGCTKKGSLQKFNVGYLASTGHILYFIAQEKEYFNEEGLDVELFLFNNSGEGINSVILGKLDAGSFGTAPPFTFIARGQPLSIFGGQMFEGHALIAKPENANAFRDLNNFRGKTIATVRLATGDIVFRYGFSEAGIDWKNEITINEFESPAAVVEAVRNDGADAGVVWTPFRKTSEQQGLSIVQYSGNIPHMSGHPCCRQIALTENLEKYPERYESFLRALIRAYDFYQSNHDESLTILAKYVQVNRDILEAETYGQHIGSSPDPDKANVVQFWNAMKTAEYIDSDIDIAQHINTNIYASALSDVIAKYPGNKSYEQLKASFSE